MRVFLAGAAGVIGRTLVPRLVAAGHEVTGTTRQPDKAGSIRAQGAEPAVVDAFDRDGLREAVGAARPEVVVHELTDLPQAFDPRKMKRQLAGNVRLRREGTRNLVDAALAAGARRIVAQSIAFAYPPRDGVVKTEEEPLYLDAPPAWRPSVEAVVELERLVTQTPGLEGLGLRYGYFYGPGSAYAPDGAYADLVRRRRFPIGGGGTGVFSFVHVEDAAGATVLAVERGRPGIYNIVDDDPAPISEWLPAFAEAVGAPAPRRVPRLLVRLLAGSFAAEVATELRGASNAKARRELGWEPTHPTWRAALGL